MGDVIHDLEANGYVTRTPDPTDKRAYIVTFTERGHQFLADAYQIKLEIEAEYEAILGTDLMKQLKAALILIREHSAEDEIQ
jgi:DNA-binding MarR family transcriptional regulator